MKNEDIYNVRRMVDIGRYDVNSRVYCDFLIKGHSFRPNQLTCYSPSTNMWDTTVWSFTSFPQLPLYTFVA
jgi:hypothetical protein